VPIIGFALHNSTEGFEIVGPLGDVRPSWRWLLLAGLGAGGPTFVGYQITSDALKFTGAHSATATSASAPASRSRWPSRSRVMEAIGAVERQPGGQHDHQQHR
jgi:hypothetical protein